jgi:hypothetical protein
MWPPRPVPSSEFTRNFGHYRILAQCGAVAVSFNGGIAGYFLRPDEYEAFLRYKSQHETFATVDLPREKAESIIRTRMDRCHNHLNALLHKEQQA